MTHIVRRMGSTPEQRGSNSGANCPDVLLLESGDYLVIGRIAGSVDRLAKALAAHKASVGRDEIAVVVPADCMQDAVHDIASRQSVYPSDQEYIVQMWLDDEQRWVVVFPSQQRNEADRRIARSRAQFPERRYRTLVSTRTYHVEDEDPQRVIPPVQQAEHEEKTP